MAANDGGRVRLERLAHGGEAVGKLADGRVVFVFGGAPGDLVQVELTDERRRYARARLVSVIEPSPIRVAPPCPYFGSCGGCQWQHVSYQAQLDAKQATVSQALSHPVRPILPSPEAYEYRWRTRQHKAGSLLGYRAWRSRALIDVAHCAVLEPALDRAVSNVRAQLRRDGELCAQLGNDGEVAMVSGQFRSGPGEVDLGEPGESPFWIAADRFAQPSRHGQNALRRLVCEAAEAKAERVLELYAGVGNFTRDLASQASEVVAVEGEAEARPLFERNVRGRATLVSAPVVQEVKARISRGEEFSVIVLDPPREGAKEVVALLPKLSPQRIVYVSCDPMTLARDVHALRDLGFQVAWAAPVDLMPQTFHVETVVRLQRLG